MSSAISLSCTRCNTALLFPSAPRAPTTWTLGSLTLTAPPPACAWTTATTNRRRQSVGAYTEAAFRQRADEAYERLAGPLRRRYDWLRPDLFKPNLAADLRADALALLGILADAGPWDPNRDAKLRRLRQLLTRDHPQDKVLIFSQFADTVDYVTAQLRDGSADHPAVERLEGVTGASQNPTVAARHFSPVSNEVRDKVPPDQELRVVIATDILSEGQNLQDGAIVVNYDLPWAIIRLAQRAGRVDRIGQAAARILCYSFLPADGVERVLRLRSRVRQRLRENAEVVGTDEDYFEDDEDRPILDLYNERAGVLDGDEDTEIDLASYAFQIWKNATDDQPSLRRQIEKLPDVVYSTRTHPLRHSRQRRESILYRCRSARCPRLPPHRRRQRHPHSYQH